MTREEAKTLAPIIQAFGQGKDIQIECQGRWIDLGSESPAFASSPDKYRVKPEPREFTVIRCGGSLLEHVLVNDPPTQKYTGELERFKVREVL